MLLASAEQYRATVKNMNESVKCDASSPHMKNSPWKATAWGSWQAAFVLMPARGIKKKKKKVLTVFLCIFLTNFCFQKGFNAERFWDKAF